MHVYHSKCQPTDDKQSMKGVWSHHSTFLKFLVAGDWSAHINEYDGVNCLFNNIVSWLYAEKILLYMA